MFENVIKTGASIFGGLMLADFVAGLFHWFEDRYGNPKWKIIGKTIEANQRHHAKPRLFLDSPIWRRNREVWVLAVMFGVGFAYFGWLNTFTLTALAAGAFANEIHACAHKLPRENGRIITAIQRTGLMQSFKHHAQHHRKGKDSHYCVITNYLNPVLERMQFYPALERIIYRLTGISPRLDPTVNPKYRRTYV